MAAKDPNTNIVPGVSANSLNYHIVTTEEMARRNRGGMNVDEYFDIVRGLDFDGKAIFDKMVDDGQVGPPNPLDRNL